MTPDFEPPQADARPLTWADAFPWLAGASETGGVHWWDESIAETDLVTWRSRLGSIAELAMGRLTRWTIGQVFPGLAPNIDLLQLGLPTRATNALGRFGCGVSDQLMGVTLEEMMGWRQVGLGTVDAILQGLAEVSLSSATPTVTSRSVEPYLTADSPAASNDFPLWVASLAEDLSTVARWYAAIGLPSQPLLSGDRPNSPDTVADARQRLEALVPSDVLDDAELGLDAAGLFDAALSVLDPRAVEILRTRLFADERVTLDDLGRTHGVTRERIRQIEGKARGIMLSIISDSDSGALADVARSARDLIGTIRPLEDLLTLIPALSKDVQRVSQPAWRVLDRLDDAYEIEDGWCVVPTMTAAKSVTQTRLQEAADPYGMVRVDEIDLVDSSCAEKLPQITAAWLTYCGYVIHGEFVLTRTSSVADYAVGVLALEGSPLSAQEIVDRFVFHRSARSLGNALASDDRFDRVDRDRWALSDWGMEAYTGIRSIIRELVARSGGRARLDDVVEHMTTRYTVSSSSIAAYAAAPPFMTRDGFVQLDSGDRTVRKAPQRTRRMFRLPDGWAYRVRITTDHLRGSGSVAPRAIATILGLEAGQTIYLDSPLGPQAIAWTGIQPSFGTIRRFLIAGDIAADAEVFLIMNDDHTFSFEKARDVTDDPLADALSLVGAAPSADLETARLALARAIELPDTSPLTSILGEYRSRGDDDVAERLLLIRDLVDPEKTRSQPRHSAEVDDILQLL